MAAPKLHYKEMHVSDLENIIAIDGVAYRFVWDRDQTLRTLHFNANGTVYRIDADDTGRYITDKAEIKALRAKYEKLYSDEAERRATALARLSEARASAEDADVEHRERAMLARLKKKFADD